MTDELEPYEIERLQDLLQDLSYEKPLRGDEIAQLRELLFQLSLEDEPDVEAPLRKKLEKLCKRKVKL